MRESAFGLVRTLSSSIDRQAFCFIRIMLTSAGMLCVQIILTEEVIIPINARSTSDYAMVPVTVFRFRFS